MSVNISVVTFNRLELTKICLSSLLAATRGDFFVNVVDNGSSDGTIEWLKSLAGSDSRVCAHFLGGNRGVAVAANYGWAEGDSRGAAHYLKLDNDVEILRPDWLEELRATAEANPGLGVLGYQFLSRHAVRRIGLGGGGLFRLAECCGGGCALVPGPVHEKLGFWNEDYGRYGFEDFDYSLRASLAGFKVGYLDRDDMVRHLGYELALAPSYEQSKKDSVSHALSGEKLFVINKLLFSDGVRPLYVSRRHLPRANGGKIVFSLDPHYKAILKLQRDMLEKVSYEADNRNIRLDLRGFREENEKNNIE